MRYGTQFADALTFIFRIVNRGDSILSLVGENPVTLTGSDVGDFTIVQQPVSRELFPTETGEPFIIRFKPSSVGVKRATVEIANGTAVSPFRFDIQATGFVGPRLKLDVTVSDVNEGCARTTEIQAAPDTELYYCYQAVNVGTVNLSRADLIEQVSRITSGGTTTTDRQRFSEEVIDLSVVPDATDVNALPRYAYFYIVPETITGNVGDVITNNATWTSYNFDLANPTNRIDVSSSVNRATVTLREDPPVFGSATPTAGTYGTAYTYNFVATGLPRPTYSISAGSLPPGLTLDGVSGVLSGTPTQAGSYSFSVTASNRVGSVVQPVTLLINRAPLRITADDKTMRAGDPLPAFTVSYSGFVLGDTVAVLDQPVSISTNVRDVSRPGTYTIILSGAADANYDITMVNGKLTIEPTPQNPFRLFVPLNRR